MTIQSRGYPGTFAPGDVWADLQYALGNRYYVDDPASAVCTPQVAGTRQISVSNGRLGGWGVADRITAPEVLTLPTVASGTRWFLIVARRTWGVTNQTTLVALDPGWTAKPTTLPAPGTTDASWNQAPGTRDDQPLWLVPLTAGQTVPGAPTDIRLIGSGNDFIARDDFVRQYANWAGIKLQIGTVVWRRQLNTAGTGLDWYADPGPFGSIAGMPTISDAALLPTVTAGWSRLGQTGVILRNIAWKIGNLVAIEIHLRRTGAKILPDANGNFSDAATLCCQVVSGWRPLYDARLTIEYLGATDTRTSSHGAFGGYGYISKAGNVSLAAGEKAPIGINQNLTDVHSLTLSTVYPFAA